MEVVPPWLTSESRFYGHFPVRSRVCLQSTDHFQLLIKYENIYPWSGIWICFGRPSAAQVLSVICLSCVSLSIVSVKGALALASGNLRAIKSIVPKLLSTKQCPYLKGRKFDDRRRTAVSLRCQRFGMHWKDRHGQVQKISGGSDYCFSISRKFHHLFAQENQIRSPVAREHVHSFSCPMHSFSFMFIVFPRNGVSRSAWRNMMFSLGSSCIANNAWRLKQTSKRDKANVQKQPSKRIQRGRKARPRSEMQIGHVIPRLSSAMQEPNRLRSNHKQVDALPSANFLKLKLIQRNFAHAVWKPIWICECSRPISPRLC